MSFQRAPEGDVFDGANYKMQPRINLRRHDVSTERSFARRAWSLFRRAQACHDGPDYNTCEKGIDTNITNLAIILGVLIPVVVAVIVLIYLHRRNVRRLRQEDAHDPHKGLDFGLGDAASKSSKRKSLFGIGGEKLHHKGNQMSMDMNLSSPYLLPPNVQHSHDSVHSLARTFPGEQDPYRPVAQYANSETASLTSFRPSRNASQHTGSKRGSVMSAAPSASRMPPSRIDSMSKSSSSPGSKLDPFSTPTIPDAAYQVSRSGDKKEPVRSMEPTLPDISVNGYPGGWEGGLEMPDARHDQRISPPTSPKDLPSPPFEHDGPIPAALASVPYDAHSQPSHAGPNGHDYSHKSHVTDPNMEPTLPQIHSSEQIRAANGASLQSPSHGSHSQAPVQAPQGHGDEVVPQPYQTSSYQQRQQPQDGLAVPHLRAKRQSVGFRPLPPDEVMESEDPEYRANRIRSFYKEYFDDKEAPPPVPALPSGVAYYEDYDSGYLGDAAYYDAETNAFVMPYAQPVTRRAMTPPPAGRFRGGPSPSGPRGGGRGPSRGPHGSFGGMSYSSGPRRPRAGSSLSPRPGSSASVTIRGGHKKNLPPPAALNTLPTPSKLKDDSFAIFNAADFAPPSSFKDQAAGRSQSPLGERRQYHLPVPVASPLVTSFDELSVLPSPHLLRKSSTFTNLDFAPPKKFKDADSTMSDAGSIRSNRSGVSAVQLDAIRRGAGRVSRLPGDTIFTSAALEDTLKPQWGMRP